MIPAGTDSTGLVSAWLYATLQAAPAVVGLLGTMMFPGIAPPDPTAVAAPGTAGPDAFATWQATLPGDDVRPLVGAGTGGRLLVVCDYTVKAVVADSGDLAGTIAAAIDAAIDGKVEAPPGRPAMAVACSRRQPLHYPDTTGARLWWHSGGIYRLELS